MPACTTIPFFIAAFLFPAISVGQIDPTLLKLRELASSPSLNLNKGQTSAANALVDNSIDQDRYHIGGGDVFSIHIVELPSVEYMVVIDQNCDAVIPDLGIIRLGKKTLSQAKTTLSDFVRSKLKKPYEVYVALVRAKSAIVTVSGAILNPGTYQLEGTNRLVDVFRLANNHILPPFSDYNYRDIKVMGRDTTESYDLFKFLFLNDNSQNPYVYPGDNIRIAMADRRVYISGNLRNTTLGYLPIKPGESAKDFLSLFTFDHAADSDNIIIMKYGENSEIRSLKFSLKQPDGVELDDRDVISIPPKANYIRAEIVEVTGEANRPGSYPIIPQKTAAMTVIEQAGGAKPTGNLKRAFILRRTKATDMDKAMLPQANPQLPTPAIQRTSPSVVRPEIAAALTNVTASRDFSIIPLSGNAKNVILQPGDDLHIPRIENAVYISGNVRLPGAYPFVEGKDQKYYIDQAGGFTSRSDKSNVFVLVQYHESYQIKHGSAIEDGDVIVVPESQQFKFLTNVLLPTISVFLTALSTAFVIYSVTK
jgi:protein involved in polysaccharide export with SLBB domain